MVVTLFPDDNKKYLSTDLMRDEPTRDHYLSPSTELLGFRSFRRPCETCCDPAECAGDLALSGAPVLQCPRRLANAVR